MDNQLYLYFVFNCVAELKHFPCAKALYVSQPAVSKVITNLEENLKQTLFIRSSRGVKLTDEGQLYINIQEAFEILKKGRLDDAYEGTGSGPSKNRCQLYPMQIYPAALPKPLLKAYPI